MRLAVCTTAFDRALRDGDLTQLELFEFCARRLEADGIVLDIAHFPRRDPEYVAQLKKFSADLALTIVAVRDDAIDSVGSDALLVAAGLGAPYVLTRMPESGIDPVTRYNEALAIVARAAAEAKRLNVTLAVRNVPGSLAADAFELGRLRKEADSAWLRFALDPTALVPAALAPSVDSAAVGKLRSHVVLAYRLLCEVPGSGDDALADSILGALAGFVGFLCLDYAGEPPEVDAAVRFVAGWRRALARRVLDGRVVDPHVPS